MGYGYMMNYGGGGIFMGIIWIAVIIAVVYAVTRISKTGIPGTGAGPEEKPMDILKKRYAKGEITKEEFDKMKKDLE